MKPYRVQPDKEKEPFEMGQEAKLLVAFTLALVATVFMVRDCNHSRPEPSPTKTPAEACAAARVSPGRAMKIQHGDKCECTSDMAQ